MSWNKNINVKYHFIEAGNSDYFHQLQTTMNAAHKADEKTGTFDCGEEHFIWKLNYIIDLNGDNYFISLVKGRTSWPVWFSDNGEIDEVPLKEGELGDIFYALINPSKAYIISLAAGAGSPTPAFKKFLNIFSLDSGVKLSPVFENNINIITLAWDYYKKISFSVNFPTYDDLAEFKTTQAGSLLGVIDELSGLKADISIKAPRQKQVLNAAQVRDIAKELIACEFCTSLKLRGADFETESIEEYDLKNAQIKYSEYVEISGSFMSEAEAIGILRRSYADKTKELLGAI